MPLGPNGCSAVAVGARSPATVRFALSWTRTPRRQSFSASACSCHESTRESALRSGPRAVGVAGHAGWAPTEWRGVAIAATDATVANHRVVALFRPNTIHHLPCVRKFLEAVRDSE